VKSLKINTYIVIFFVVIAAVLLTHLVPVGKFEPLEQYIWDAKHMEIREQIVPNKDTFEFLHNPDGSRKTMGVSLFAPFHGVGLFNYLFEGIKSSVGIFAFILIIGGAFAIVIRTGAVDNGIMAVIRKLKGKELAIIPTLFIIFSLGGATIGMGECAIPFVMIVVPLMVAMKYDAVTGVLITYGATQVGFGSSWMNPFSVGIAQAISGIPVLSGMSFRIFIFILCTAIGATFSTLYAMKIKKNPQKSVSYESDAYFRNEAKDMTALSHGKLSGVEAIVLALFGLTLLWVGYGVIAHDYEIAEIATQFLILGIVSGSLAALFRNNNMTFSDVADSFANGAKDLLPAALVVAMAKGIILILTLGGNPTDPQHASVLNTLLFYGSELLSGVPSALSAWVMYIGTGTLNLLIPSGSGKAALLMPFMAPLADSVGIAKQTAVLAFQLGDGFTNLIAPTSGALMGALAVSRIDWVKWVKAQIPFQLMFVAISTLLLFVAITIPAQLGGNDWLSQQELTQMQQNEKKESKATSSTFEVNQETLGKLQKIALEKNSSSWVTLKLQAGKTYKVYIIDGDNIEQFKDDGKPLMNKSEAISQVIFKLYEKGEKTKASEYAPNVYKAYSKDYYAGTTPEGTNTSTKAASIEFKAVQEEVQLLIQGRRSDLQGTVGYYLELVD